MIALGVISGFGCKFLMGWILADLGGLFASVVAFALLRCCDCIELHCIYGAFNYFEDIS